MADSVFGDLGGSGKDRQTGGPEIPDIRAVTDDSVTENNIQGATADGEPVSPYLAARRYGAAAGQGMRGNGDPGSP
jgi:hypothetical protein